MREMLLRVPVILLSALSVACSAGQPPVAAVSDPELLHGAVQIVTDAMVEAVTSPPVASRTYAYASVAAYEALRHDYPDYRSLAGQLNGFEAAPEPAAGAEYLLPLSSVYAFLSVAEKLVFAPQPVAAYRDSLVEAMRSGGVSADLVDRSVAYGHDVAAHVLAWAGEDGLKEARSLTRFQVTAEPGRWQPTPPAYMDGIEPNWMTLRPFAMRSASEFRPIPPHPFDMREGSEFRRQVEEVYEISLALTDEQREIAAFWDCNPFAMQSQGHMMFAVKKITPGGHWMGISAIASRQAGADPMRTAEAYLWVSVAVADGFISVWDEKYRSVLVRPETVIREHLDPTWLPVLQTPPFPEYSSGHSVISAAAAEVLTELFGDGFAFVDDVEVTFGIPERSFASFRQAAEEAAISRLYAGIHYRMAAENGAVQGRAVAGALRERVATREAGEGEAVVAAAGR